MAILSLASAEAATVYLDTNGATTGSGITSGATITWDGSSIWNDSLNGTSAPHAWNTGDIAAFAAGFDAAGIPYTVNVQAGGQAVGGLTFEDGRVTLAGGVLTLNGGALLTAGVGANATIGDVISGTVGLNKLGLGTITLTNSGNLYTGTTTIGGGALVITSNGALGTDTSIVSVTGNVTFGTGGGQLLLGGSYASGVTLSRNLSFSGGGTWGDGAALLTVGNNAMSGAITTSAANATRLFSSFGTTTLNGSSSLTIGSGQTTQLGGNGNWSLAGSLTTAAVANTIFEKTGGGTLIFAPASFSLGAGSEIRLSAGFTRIASGTPFTASGAILAPNGGFLEVRTDTGSSFNNAILTFRNNSTVFADHAVGSLGINSTVTFGVTSFATSNANQTFSGRNGTGITLTGASGTNNIVFATGNPMTATNSLTGLLTWNGNLSFTDTTARTYTFTGNGDSVVTGDVLGTGGPHVFLKAGTGQITLQGAAGTYTGATTITGTMVLNKLNAIGTSNAVNLTTGALSYLGDGSGGETTSKIFNLTGTLSSANGYIYANMAAGATPLILSSGVSAGGAGSKSLVIGGSNTLDNKIQGFIQDNSSTNKTSLYKTGLGTWVYAPNAVAVTGPAGITVTGNANENTLAVSSTAGLTVGMWVTGTNIPAGAVITAIGAGTITISDRSGNAVPAATALTFGNVANFTGGVSITGGTLKIQAVGGVNAINDTSAITFAADGTASPGLGRQTAGGTFEYDGLPSSELVGALTPTAGAGKVVLGGTTAGTTLTFASLGTRGAGAGVDFAPSTGAINFTAAVTGTNGIVGGFATINGINFVTSVGAGGSVSAPAYTAGGAVFNSTFPLTTGTSSATVNYLSAGSPAAITGAINANSIKISNGGTLNDSITPGVLTITATSATSLGGILFDNSVGTGGITGFTGITTSGAGQELIFYTGGTTATNAFTVASPVTGSGSMTKGGSGLMVMSGASSFTGNVNINEGTLRLSGATASIGTGQVAATVMNLRQGAIFDLNGAGSSSALQGGPAQPTVAIGMLVGAGTVQNSGGGTSAQSVLLIGGNGTTVNSTAVFTGVIQNSGGVMNVTKAGNSSSIQYLLGDNSYTGVTTLTNGTLRVFKLANGGLNSGIGASTNVAGNLVFNGGTLMYTGSDATVAQAIQTPSVSTDRLFTLTALGGKIDSSGTFGNSILAANQNNAALVFSNTGDIVFASTATLTLQGNSLGDNQFDPRLGNASGTLNLTKAGSGLWILNPSTSNTYTGVTTVSGGALQVADLAASVQGLSAGSLLTLNGGVIQSSGTFNRTLGAAAGNVQLTGGTSGFSASNSKLTVNLGGGTITWGGATFNPTSLVLSNATALSEVEFANAINLGAAARTVQVDDNSSTTTDYAIISGTLTGSAGGNLIKTGSGTLVLTGANSYSGNTQISSGTLTVQTVGGTGAATSNLGDGTGPLILGAGSTTGVQLNYVGAGETAARPLQFNTTTAGITIDASGSGALILTGAITVPTAGGKTLTLRGVNTDVNEIKGSIPDSSSGATSIQKSDSGNWILSGQSTYTATTTVSGGGFGIGSTTVVSGGTTITSGPLGKGTLTVNGSSALFAANGDQSAANNITFSNVSAIVTGSYSLTFATLPTSVITNTGGNSVITNNIVSGKTLTFGGTVGGGSVFNLQDSTNARTVTFAGTGATIINALLQNGGTAAGSITLNAPGGSLTLNGANTYTGNTTLTQGTLKLGASNVIPDGAGFGNLTLNPGAGQTATLDLNGNSEVINGLTATANTAGGSTIIDNTSASPSLFTVGNNNQAITLGALVGVYSLQNTGAGLLSFKKTGTAAGTITNTATLTYRGATTVDGGSLSIAAALNGTNALNVINSGSSLSVTGALSAPASILGVQVDGGATLNIVNGAGTHQSALTSLSLGSGAGTANLGLELGSLANYDRFTLVSGSATTANTVNFNFTMLSGFGAGTYTLLSAPGGLAGAAYTFTGLGASSLTTGLTFTKVTNATTVSLTAAAAGLSFYWTNLQADNKWKTISSSLTSNWSTTSNGLTDAAGTPGSASTVNFSASNITGSGTLTTTLEAPFTINDLVFNNNTNSGAITGLTIGPGAAGTLTLTPSLTSVGVTVQTGAPAAITFTAPVILGNNQTWSVADSGTTLLASGGVSGATFGITKTGAGKVTLSGAGVTYTGTTTINAGIMELNGTTAFASAVTFGSGSTGTLQLASAALSIPSLATVNATNNNAIVQPASGVTTVLTVNQAGTTVFGGVLRDNGANTLALTKTGAGSLTLNNASTYSGGTTLSNGTLVLGNATALGTGAFTITGGTLDSSSANLVLTNNNLVNITADFTFTGTNSLNLGTGAITLGGTGARAITVTANTLTLGGAIGATAVGLTKAGSGTLVLGGNNLYTGLTTLSAGTLQANSATALGNGGAVTFTGGTLQYTANSASATWGLFKNSTSAIRLDTNGQSVVLPTFMDSTNTGGLIKSGAGTLALTSTNTYTGNTTISTGTLQLGNGGNSGSVASGGTISIASGATLQFNRADLMTVANSIISAVAGSGTVTQAGSGTTILTASNTGYTGATTVSAGTLIARNQNALGNNAATDIVTVNGGALNYAATANSPLLIGGTLTITGGKATAIGGSIGSSTTGAQITVNGAVAATGTTLAGTNIPVNIYGISGVTTGATGTYTLVHGAGGGSLTGADFVLGTVFNNTNFTVNTNTFPTGDVYPSGTDLKVDITTATALTNAYWVGTPTTIRGVSNVWAASNGTDTSNWIASEGSFSNQALVPGSATDVWITTNSGFVNSHPNSTVLGADMTIKSLHIADSDANFSGLRLNADGNTLTIGTGGITVDNLFPDVPANTIAAKVALGAAQAWNNNSVNALTVSGVVSGGFALTIGGSGLMVLSGANTYSGGTSLGAGASLTLGNATAIGTGSLSIATGAALDSAVANLVLANNNPVTINGDFTFTGTNFLNMGTGAVTLGGAGARTITVTNDTLVLGGPIGATGVGLTKAGAGTLTLGGNNLYTGLTTLSAGILKADSATALGNGGNITFGGGTLQYTASSAGTDWGSRFKSSSGAISLDTNTQDVTIASLIDSTNGAGLIKVGFGGLKLFNVLPTLAVPNPPSNTYTGTNTVNNGALIVNRNEALGNLANTVVVNGSTSRTSLTNGSLVLEGGYTSGVDLSRSLSVSGFGPNFNQSGSLVSVRTNQISGAVTVPSSTTFVTQTRFISTNGRLTFSGPVAASVLTAPGSGQTVQTIFGGVNATGVGNFELKGTLTGNSYTSFIVKTSAGTLILNSSLDTTNFAGTFQLQGGGTMRIDSGNLGTNSAIGINTSTNATAVLDMNGGTLEVRSDSGTIGRNVYQRAGATFFADHALSGTVINGAATFGQLTFEENQTLTLNGRNGFGVTFGAAPVNGGNANSIINNNLNGLLTFTGDFWTNTDNSGNRTMSFGGNGDTTLTGNIVATPSSPSVNGGSHSLVKSGTGILTINGTASTYTGNTTITGTVSVGNLGAINKTSSAFGVSTGSILLNSGAFLYTGATDSMAKPFSLLSTTANNAILSSGSGALTLTGNVGAAGVGAKTLFLGGTNANDNTFSSLLIDNNVGGSTTGPTGLTKIGAGTWVLTAPTAAAFGTSSSVALAAASGSTTMTLTSGNTSGLLVGQVLAGVGTNNQITSIIDSIRFTVSLSSTISAGNFTINPIPAASTTTSGGPWSGALTIANGTLKLSATSATSDIVKNANALVFNVDAFSGNQSAGGTLNYVNNAGTTVNETLGTITATAGAGKVVLTPNGQATTLTFGAASPLGNRTAGATLDYQPGTGTISFTTPPALQNGLLTDASAKKAYATFNGVDWAALSGSNVSAATYTPFVGALGVATTNYSLAVGAVTTTSFAQSFNSLKLAPTAGGGTLQLNGTLTLTSGGLLFDNTNGSMTIANNGTSTNTLGAAGSELIIITNGNSSSNTLTVSALIGSTTASLTKAGTRTLVVSGNNTYTGNTVINEGTLQLSGPVATLGVLSTAGTTMTIRQGGILDLNGAGASTALSGGPAQPSLVTGMINGAGTIQNSGGGTSAQAVLVIGSGTITTGTAVFSGVIKDNGGVMNVTKAGNASSIQYLTGDNSYTGVTTLTSGTLRVFKLADGGLNSGIGASTNAAGNLVFNGGTLMYTGSDATALQLTQAPSVSTNRLFTVTANGGVIDSSGNYGNSVLAAAQNNAALVFSNAGTAVMSGSGDRTLTLQGNSTGDNLLNPKLSTVSGGALSVTKAGSGVWVLGNTANDYAGPTTISGGVLRATGNALSPNSNLTLNGGVLEATGTLTRTVGTGAGNVQWTANGAGGFAAAGAKLTVNLAGSQVWGTAQFLGTGSMILNSSTALDEVEWATGFQITQGLGTTLNATTTAGGTTVTLNTGSTAGLTLGQVISGNANIPAGYTIASIISGTQFTLNSGTGVLASASPTSTTFAAGGYRQIIVNDNGNTNTDFATITGVISGNGTLSKAGGGVLQLFGANIYTGATAITAGTLVVNSLGNSAGSTDSSVGAHLGANTAAQAVTIGNGSTGNAFLQYVGTGETSDRRILIDTTTGNDQIYADGSGPLVLTNVVNNTSLIGARTLSLRGSNTQANVLGGALADGAPNGAVTSPFNITIDGGATWVLAGNNSFTGTVTASSGSLGVGSTNAFGNGTLLLTNGLQYMFAYGADQSVASTSRVQQQSGVTTFFIGNYSLEFKGSLQLLGSTTNTNNIVSGKTLAFADVNATANGTLTFDGAGDTIVNGAITNAAATTLNLTYNGTGSLTLAGTSTYGGTTLLKNGTTILSGGGGGSQSTNRLPATTALTLGTATTSATLQLGDASGPTNQTIKITAATFPATTPATFIVGGNTSPNPDPSTLTVFYDVTATPLDFSFIIGKSTSVENNLKLAKTGAGTMNVNTVNRYTGGTDVGAPGGPSGGTLVVGNTNPSASLGDVFAPAPMNVYAGTVQVSSVDSQIVTDLNLGGGAAGTSATAAIIGNMQVNGNITYNATNNPNPAAINGGGTIKLRPATFTTINVGSSAAGSGVLVPDLTISTPLDGSQSIHKVGVGSSRVDLQACKLEYSIVSPK